MRFPHSTAYHTPEHDAFPICSSRNNPSVGKACGAAERPTVHLLSYVFRGSLPYGNNAEESDLWQHSACVGGKTGLLHADRSGVRQPDFFIATSSVMKKPDSSRRLFPMFSSYSSYEKGRRVLHGDMTTPFPAVSSGMGKTAASGEGTRAWPA